MASDFDKAFPGWRTTNPPLAEHIKRVDEARDWSKPQPSQRIDSDVYAELRDPDE